jgi:hypothetical protein
MKDNFQDEFISVIKGLNGNQKIKLLDYVKTLPGKKKVSSNANLLKFAGTISKKDLKLMEKVIEKDCERIY